MSKKRNKPQVLDRHVQGIDAFSTAMAAKMQAADRMRFRQATREMAAEIVKPSTADDAGRVTVNVMINTPAAKDKLDLIADLIRHAHQNEIGLRAFEAALALLRIQPDSETSAKIKACFVRP